MKLFFCILLLFRSPQVLMDYLSYSFVLFAFFFVFLSLSFGFLLSLILDIFPSFLTGSAESIVNFRSDNGSLPMCFRHREKRRRKKEENRNDPKNKLIKINSNQLNEYVKRPCFFRWLFTIFVL